MAKESNLYWYYNLCEQHRTPNLSTFAITALSVSSKFQTKVTNVAIIFIFPNLFHSLISRLNNNTWYFKYVLYILPKLWKNWHFIPHLHSFKISAVPVHQLLSASDNYDICILSIEMLNFVFTVFSIKNITTAVMSCNLRECFCLVVLKSFNALFLSLTASTFYSLWVNWWCLRRFWV